MSSDIRRQLLEEFAGLFEGGGTELEGFEGTDIERIVPAPLQKVASSMAVSTSGGEESDTDRAPENDAGAADPLQETARALGRMAADIIPADTFAATVAGSNTHGGTAASVNETSGGGSSAGSIAATFLESGFGIVPLVTGLLGLLSGGPAENPPLEKYSLPHAISFESAETGGRLLAADFDQTGAPRITPAAVGTATGGDGTGNATVPGGNGASPQITVNVQAMDAQSFLDYSGQIAQAVRSAMLNLSSLNDVVSEL